MGCGYSKDDLKSLRILAILLIILGYIFELAVAVYEE